MTPLAVIETIEGLLIEERSAIVALDATRVAGIAEEKESLMTALRDALPAVGVEHRPRLRELRDALRQNALLLAHARDCLRDALAAFCVDAPASSKSARGALAARPGARVSIRG